MSTATIINVALDEADALRRTTICEDLNGSFVSLDRAWLIHHDTDMHVVLVPGRGRAAIASVNAALSTLSQAGISLDLADERTVAEVGRPSWVHLHSCDDPAHDFHLESHVPGDVAGAHLAHTVTFRTI